jgi:hypothetical protein
VTSEQKVPRSVEQRIVIKFLVGENVPSAESYHRLQQQSGEECLSRTRVFEWCKCFREGRERFAEKDAVMRTVRVWIRRQPQAFFEKGIRMLPERWKKVLTPEGSTLKTDMCK